jgi:hypothetical protein
MIQAKHAVHRDTEDEHRNFARASEEKAPLRRPRHIWVDNTETYLKVRAYDNLEHIHVVWNRIQRQNPVIMATNPDSIKGGAFLHYLCDCGLE